MIYMQLKTCKKCLLEQNISCFSLSFNKNKSKSWAISICKSCQKNNGKLYSVKNRSKLNEKMSRYRKENPEKIKKYKQIYYINNKNKVIQDVKKYTLNNSDKINLYQKKYRVKNADKISLRMKKYFQEHKSELLSKQKSSYKNVPEIKIRKILSSAIRIALLNNSSNKKKLSCLKFLNYSIDELKHHLENKFEPWMNWNNWGSYKKDIWNDNDLNTWTWQIDHIIPQSEFKYSSMDDGQFRDCWALKNLRPLSSKQNILDGNRRDYCE